MPETTVNKNDLLVFRQYDIWPSWEVFDMQSKSVSEPVKDRTHGFLRPRVFTPDFTHITAASNWVNAVHEY